MVKSFISKNCHHARTSDDIDMKLGPVTKLDRRITTTSKKMMMSLATYDVIVIFSILVDLEQSGIRTPGTWYMILTFSLIATFRHIKIENKSNKSLTAFLLWVKVLFLLKMLIFCQKRADISKIQTKFRLNSTKRYII